MINFLKFLWKNQNKVILTCFLCMGSEFCQIVDKKKSEMVSQSVIKLETKTNNLTRFRNFIEFFWKKIKKSRAVNVWCTGDKTSVVLYRIFVDFSCHRIQANIVFGGCGSIVVANSHCVQINKQTNKIYKWILSKNLDMFHS